MKHLTRIDEVSREAMLDLFERAARFAAEPASAAARTRHEGRIVATLFYEPSTRTRLSFESAAMRLGARCLGFSDPSASSATKGETLIDTIRTVQRYADLIVLRHSAEGAAALAAKVAMVPIINAGDGGHEHPTQTLFDLYTIRQRFGELTGRKIGFLGDLRFGRTVHSLSHAANLFGAELIFIAPNELQMPEHLLRRLRPHTNVRVETSAEAVIGDLDVLYVTRVQAERMDEQLRRRIGPPQIVTPQLLSQSRPDMLVLHPLPRVDEISQEVDEDERAFYFEQLANGVVMRMALLDAMLLAAPVTHLGAKDQPQRYDDPPWRSAGDDRSCGNAKCVTNQERGVMPRWVSDSAAVRCGYCDFEI
jgi:aspartate carbamoyltransferase catalytic subunit